MRGLEEGVISENEGRIEEAKESKGSEVKLGM